ncbi:hypothetical protein LguiB_020235 [Lonicera macranthoides]
MENPQSSPQEPTPKKLKMSTTTTTSDDEDRHTTTERKPKYKRRKVAIFFAYCGVGYQGMQKNPGAKTIEGDLEEALFFSGAIPEQDRGHPKRLDWARSARTDKGVSAVGQVVSGRFYIDPPGLIERLNSKLPPQFRIFGYKRATASFNAKKFCDRRRYVYLLPVFALDPSAHRDRESVLASLGSDSELVKCLECSERGRKVAGVMGKRNFESTTTLSEVVSVQSDISSNNATVLLQVDVKEGNSVSLVNGDHSTSISAAVEELVKEAAPSESQVLHSEMVIEEHKVHSDSDGCANRGDEPLKDSGFCYGEREKETFNRILKLYEGTHNFHNFTTRIKAEDPSARRYIISFQANTTVTVEGIEFVKCEIIGQSFMLHQIRKMVGVAVAIMRNCAPESFIEAALKPGANITVPTAPEVGLYLDECFFTSYNKKWKDTHEEVSMEAYAEEAEYFKLKHIYTHIASTEHKEGAVGLWLHSLNYRNYPDLRIVSNEGTSDISAVVEDKAE